MNPNRPSERRDDGDVKIQNDEPASVHGQANVAYLPEAPALTIEERSTEDVPPQSEGNAIALMGARSGGCPELDGALVQRAGPLPGNEPGSLSGGPEKREAAPRELLRSRPSQDPRAGEPSHASRAGGRTTLEDPKSGRYQPKTQKWHASDPRLPEEPRLHALGEEHV
jgi:hypothetical protein